jgi:hypothetical protein
MASLYITANTLVGKFRGRVNKNTEVSTEELEKTRDALQGQINRLDYIVLYDGRAEITLPGPTIQRSVLTFEIA